MQYRAAVSCLVPLLVAGIFIAPRVWADEPSASAEQPKITTELKKIFATNCSWCHDGFGMAAGKGPKLAGTGMTAEQVRDRILNGKSGAMPPFRKTLSAEQVQALADYIKSLPAN